MTGEELQKFEILLEMSRILVSMKTAIVRSQNWELAAYTRDIEKKVEKMLSDMFSQKPLGQRIDTENLQP